MKRYFREVLFGFIAAVVLAIVPPIVFLAIPAAGFFLFVVPIWSVGVVGLLFFGFLTFGRIPAAIGVALLAIAVALSPVGRATAALVGEIDKNIKQGAKANAYLADKRKECATGYVPLKKPSVKHDLLVLENMNVCGDHNYDVPDTVAILTGMRVVEAGRYCFTSRISEVRETIAERSDTCGGGRDSADVGITPSLVQRKVKVAPLRVDVCLRRRILPDPPDDRTPAIVLRPVPFGGDCQVTEVIERTASGDVDLGRLHYEAFNQRYYPDLPVPEGISRYNSLVVFLSEVLQQDLSDKALLKRAVEAKN
jgi:hypothetical protein